MRNLRTSVLTAASFAALFVLITAVGPATPRLRRQASQAIIDAGPHLQGRPHLAAGNAQSLDHGLGHRRVRRRQAARLDDPPARDPHRRRALRGTWNVGAGVEAGKPKPMQLGTCCKAAPPVLEFDQNGKVVQGWGQGRGRLRRLAAQPARHLRRSPGQRLGRQPHAPPRDEVHARRQAGAARSASTTRTTAAPTPRCSAARRASGSIRRPTRPSSPTATATAA